MSESAHRWWTIAVPAVTFLVGLGLGLVIMVATGDPSEPDADTPAADGSPSASSSADDTGTPDTVVTVPGACEDAARNISEATRLLDDVAASVRDFQPDELVDLLDQLEQLDAETRELAEQCRTVDVTATPSPSAS
jgi:hypothetical protein